MQQADCHRLHTANAAGRRVLPSIQSGDQVVICAVCMKQQVGFIPGRHALLTMPVDGNSGCQSVWVSVGHGAADTCTCNAIKWSNPRLCASMVMSGSIQRVLHTYMTCLIPSCPAAVLYGAGLGHQRSHIQCGQHNEASGGGSQQHHVLQGRHQQRCDYIPYLYATTPCDGLW